MSQNSRNFVAAVHAFDAVVQRMDDSPASSQWQAATPCEGWTAADLVEHQCAVLNGVAAVASSGAMAGPKPPADMSNPKAAWCETRDSVLSSIDRKGVLAQQGPFWFDAPTVDDMIGIVTWDAVTHAWDLATAVGQPSGLDDALVQTCYDVITPMADMLLASGRIGPAVEVAADAPILQRYLGLVGRKA